MIFLGDVAHPFNKPPIWTNMDLPWKQQPAVANLEGALISDGEHLIKQKILFNNISILEAFKTFNIKAVSLANNHITDIPGGLINTIDILKSNSIYNFGAGGNVFEAAKPIEIKDSGHTFLLMGFGWETIQCRRANNNKAGVNSLSPEILIKLVKKYHLEMPQAVIVIVLHWNYEMELYPQPAHRQLAFDLIDNGANAIIGHHPHRVGGIEMYNQNPIVYSLGNWWFPHGKYFNGSLTFDDESLLQIALEWVPGELPVCHWFSYSRADHYLTYIKSDLVSNSSYIHKLIPYHGMSHGEYLVWFKKNRVKNKMLPVYNHYDAKVANTLKDYWVAFRHIIINWVKNNLKWFKCNH